MAKSVVRLDKVRSTRVGHIYSVVSTQELENGFVGALGGLKDGERELYDSAVPTKADPLVLIAAPEINVEEYRSTDNALGNFSIEAGVPARAYELERTDIFSVSTDGVDLIGANPVKGNYVVADGSHKLKEVATLAGDEVFVGKILGKETIGTATVVGMAGAISRITDFVVIEVVKNA